MLLEPHESASEFDKIRYGIDLFLARTAKLPDLAEHYEIEGVEGEAQLVESPSAEISTAYAEKYGMAYPPDSNLYAVRPLKVFGLIDDEEQFPGTATRWTF